MIFYQSSMMFCFWFGTDLDWRESNLNCTDGSFGSRKESFAFLFGGNWMAINQRFRNWGFVICMLLISRGVDDVWQLKSVEHLGFLSKYFRFIGGLRSSTNYDLWYKCTMLSSRLSLVEWKRMWKFDWNIWNSTNGGKLLCNSFAKKKTRIILNCGHWTSILLNP